MTSWKIPLSRPDIADADRDAVARVLAGDVLSLGPEAIAFEREFAAYLGPPRSSAELSAACVANGTAGLFLALRALGITRGQVLTPSYGFVGTAHAIRLAGAEPRFVDVDPESLVIDVDHLEAGWTPEVSAVLPVHIFGTPPPMRAICDWSRARGLPVIEDACEALGGAVSDEACGAVGDAGVFAFYPNKQMTTGEGGMVVSPDRDLIERIRGLRNQGRGEGEFEFATEGFNFRLSEIQCALGRSQLARLDQFLADRESIAERYRRDLEGVDGVRCLGPVPAGDRRSWFVFPVLVDDSRDRSAVRSHLAANGIQTAPYFRAIHHMEPYSDPSLRADSPLAVTNDIAGRSFAIPFFNRLAEEDRQLVVSVLRDGLRIAREQRATSMSI